MAQSFLDQYWAFQKEACTTYNDRTIVFIEKGSFMECYSTDTFGHASTVARLLNMVVTKCNKNLPVSDTNPYMVGFPKVAQEKNVPVLIANDWTVVWVEQVWDHHRKNVLRREITRVITPGTYLEQPPSDDYYYICCIHTVGERHYVFSIDTSIGVSETLSLERDEDLVWYVGVYNPREVLSIGTTPFVRQCMVDNRVFYEKQPQPYNDRLYQQQVFKKVFGDDATDGDVRTLHMNTAMACLLDFIWTCHPRALSHIRYPKENPYCHTHMTLHNNTVHQLDLTPSANGSGVLGKVNKTRTCMGKRLLKTQLLRPMVSEDEIEAEHERVEKLLAAPPLMDAIQAVLSKLPDMDRLLKRVELGVATPQQLATLHASIRHASQLGDCGLWTSEDMRCLSEWDAVFQPDTDTPDFLCGYDATYDALKEKGQGVYDALVTTVLEPLQSYCCKLEQSKDRGYYVTTTTKKGEQIPKRFPHLCAKRMNGSTMCVSGAEMDALCTTYTELKTSQAERFKELVDLWMHSIRVEYGTWVRNLSQRIASLDSACAKAQCARDMGCVKPTVLRLPTACVHATSVRHPLVDNYIGNDCVLDDSSVGGLLLYGINGSGKSCYSKSIAVNLILAQAGFYVCADAFSFAPFTNVFTRIHCDDNMYKGMSSFGVEMLELRSVLRLADNRSLVIGDEVCKGTEDLSAVSLVAAALKWMSDHQVKYVFATHLHKLPTIDFVASISNLRIKHMKSEYDTQLECMIFKRQLEDGQGDPLYGIEVARQILGVPYITNLAMMARQQLSVDTIQPLASTKRSRYNKRLAVRECTHCKSVKNLHTHHITPQMEFVGEHKNNKHMNRLDNLLVLCSECHEQIHHGTLHVTMAHTIQGLQPVFTQVNSPPFPRP